MKFKNEGYSAWELSTDRANATRRALVHYAVDPELINRVTGFADTKPIADEPPTSESHHRVTLSLALSAKKATEPPAKEKSEGKAAAPTTAKPAAAEAHAPEPREFRAASPSVSPPKKSAP
jgi:chemotaxis protein MotB